MALHPGNCPLKDEFKHFKGIVRSLIVDTSEVPARIELPSHGAEREEEIDLLDHYLDHKIRRCESQIMIKAR